MHFDTSGKLVSIVDKDGKQANLSYDANGRLTRVQEASGEILFSFSYQGADTKIRTVTDLVGGVCQFSYDAYGNLVSITDPLGYVRSFAYDSYHRITSVTEERVSRQYGYDANGRVSFANVGTSQIGLSWDDAGVTITDPTVIVNGQKGVKVRCEKTAAGEIGKVIIGYGTLNYTITYAYDSQHNRIQVTRPKEPLTIWATGAAAKFFGLLLDMHD
jgi:YD repeat-containing protein